MRRFMMLAIAGLVLIAIACEGSEDQQLPVWPDEYTMRTDGDIEIQFAYPDAIANWAASVFVRHGPSGSSVGVNRDGSVKYADITGDAGTAAICAVLADGSLMEEVKSRAVELDAYSMGQGRLEPGPCEGLVTPTPTETSFPPAPAATVNPNASESDDGSTIPPYPEDYVLKLPGDVEIRFAYPSPNLDYISPIFINHFASSSRVLVDRDGRVTAATINGDEAKVAICAVLSDAVLIAEMVARAAEIEGAHVMFRQEPLEHGPCESPVIPTTTVQSPTSTPAPAATVNPEGGESIERKWPEEHRWRINDDVEALFAYEDGITDWGAPIFLDYLPTSTMVALDKEARLRSYKRAGLESMIAVCAVLNNEAVVTELRAKVAPGKSYSRFMQPVPDSDPCEAYR